MTSTTNSVKTLDSLLKLIVNAIEKAIVDDIPQQLSEHRLETNNYLGLMRGDYINENLRNAPQTNEYELMPIQRSGWRGRLIINREKKITISICTQATLRRIPQKLRTRPHYTMSLLKIQNGDLQCPYQQQSLFPLESTESFDSELLEADYRSIMSSTFNPDGFRHYFVTYRASGDELVEIDLVLMDPHYNVIEKYSLTHLIRPDFSRLTISLPIPTQPASNEQIHREATRQLSKLKPNLRKIDELA